jgi:hypothetical protein
MQERGFIRSHQKGRSTAQIRINGRRRRVVHTAVSVFFPDGGAGGASTSGGQPDGDSGEPGTDCGTENSVADGAERGAETWPNTAHAGPGTDGTAGTAHATDEEPIL